MTLDILLLFPIPILSAPIFLILCVVAIYGTKDGIDEANPFLIMAGTICAALIPATLWLVLTAEVALYKWANRPPEVQVEAR